MSGLRLYDDVTIALVLGVLTVYAVKSILRPNPLAHPLLLGRQSDVARVRNAGESASYRNYGVGHGAFVSHSLRNDWRTHRP
jgi:long-chain acyl-CoA synthetase